MRIVQRLMKAWLANAWSVPATVLLFCSLALAAGPLGHGVLVHLNPATVPSFDARHNTEAVRLNPNRDVYLVLANDSRTDQQLLDEIKTDSDASGATLNQPVSLTKASTTSKLDGQSTASVLNGQSTASVLNGQSTASVLNAVGSIALLGTPLSTDLKPVVQPLGWLLNPLLGSVLNLNVGMDGTSPDLVSTASSVLTSVPTTFYGAVVPWQYPNQATVAQIAAGASTHAAATGSGAEVALIDNGVDASNPVLASSLDGAHGYNFYDHSSNWSAYADLGDGPPASNSTLDGQSTASVLNGQSTASVLNGQSTASVLNGQSTASVLNGGSCQAEFGQDQSSGLDGQSTASVLNGQSTASVLNGQSTASVLNGVTNQADAVADLQAILACDPDFGHGTAVAGLIHLVAPQAKILPIKAFGPGGEADAATIYEAITYAIDQHVQVMNLSFSATDTTPDVQAAIHEAVADGIVVVAAAGNDNVADAVYPASLAGVVGAGAVDGGDSSLPRASFSNFDPSTGQILDVDVAAPGVQLFTTYPGTGQIWATVIGTSFSTPLVAGEAALLVQLNQTGAGNKAVIENTANPSIGGNADGGLGHGLINVQGAVQQAAPPPAPAHHFLWW